MRIGVPTEIKRHEYRVGLNPDSVAELTGLGHEVLVQQGAGAGIGADDEAFRAAGASIVPGADDVFDGAELIVKVKEPQPVEAAKLRAGHILFTYLHLAAAPALADQLLASGAVCIAYETVTDAAGKLPLLAPMSAIAGRLSIQAGARSLERPQGGRGVLISGVPGVAPADVLVLGAGVVGSNAAQVAIGMGARVTVLDRSVAALERLALHLPGVTTVHATGAQLARALRDADLVVGAVLVAGAHAPRLITRPMLGQMRPGAVIVDVAIDQGGCCETSRATTHDEPTYIVDGIVHYAVANMPGAVPRTATSALNAVTLPFVSALAQKGWRGALQDDAHLARGLNLLEGEVCHPALADALGKPCRHPA